MVVKQLIYFTTRLQRKEHFSLFSFLTLTSTWANCRAIKSFCFPKVNWCTKACLPVRKLSCLGFSSVAVYGVLMRFICLYRLTPLIRPIYFGLSVTVLTGFHYIRNRKTVQIVIENRKTETNSDQNRKQIQRRHARGWGRSEKLEKHQTASNSVLRIVKHCKVFAHLPTINPRELTWQDFPQILVPL